MDESPEGDELIDRLRGEAGPDVTDVPDSVKQLMAAAADEIVRLRDGWGVWHAEYMEAADEAHLWKTCADRLYFSSSFLVATEVLNSNPVVKELLDLHAMYEAIRYD